MDNKLSGNELTQAMLERGDEQVWCAVSNINPQQAMKSIKNVDSGFIRHIVGSENDCFLCKEGGTWKYVVPIKKILLTQDEVGL